MCAHMQRPHASLLAKLSGCKQMPPPPPTPPPPPPPAGPPSFCPATNITACVAALTSPDTIQGSCSADFEHLELRTLPPATTLTLARHHNDNGGGGGGGGDKSGASSSANDSGNGTVYIDALYIDVAGTGDSDLHVVALLYADSNGAPGSLLATGVPVLLPSHAARAFLRLPFLQKGGVPVQAGSRLWLGEQASDNAVRPPPRPESQVCFLPSCSLSLFADVMSLHRLVPRVARPRLYQGGQTRCRASDLWALLPCSTTSCRASTLHSPLQTGRKIRLDQACKAATRSTSLPRRWCKL